MRSDQVEGFDRFSPYPLRQSYDFIIIGGGINGAAIARDAALRGFSVLLLEKRDFGYGASTKTSKLAHGGIRYLEHLQFGLVKESLRERALLLKNAPHLVRPLPFILPVYAGDPHFLWEINLGLYLYDFFARNDYLPRHTKLTKEEVVQKVFGIKSSKMRGGCLFYDAQMLDNRMIFENLSDAKAFGATILNYAQVTGILKNEKGVAGVSFVNQLTQQEEKIDGNIVINATGAWSNSILAMDSDPSTCRVAPTKGIHLVVPQLTQGIALVLLTPQDGRIFFVLPWGKYSLVGTTDTLYTENPDNVHADEKEMDYLLEALQAYFPSFDAKKTSIIASFAGLRPLAFANGYSSPSEISRTHLINISKEGLITVLGGKFTTHRKIAEDVVNTAIKQLGMPVNSRPCLTAERPLPGALDTQTAKSIEKELIKAGLNQEQAEHLLGNYGKRSLEILELILKNPSEGRQICPLHPHLFAEVTFAILKESARNLDDWFCRRTAIAYSPCQGIKCLEAVADQFAALLGWSSNQRKEAIKEQFRS